MKKNLKGCKINLTQMLDEMDREDEPSQQVVTKETKLGKAWLHKSQDLMSDAELEEARKKTEGADQ